MMYIEWVMAALGVIVVYMLLGYQHHESRLDRPS